MRFDNFCNYTSKYAGKKKTIEKFEASMAQEANKTKKDSEDEENLRVEIADIISKRLDAFADLERALKSRELNGSFADDLPKFEMHRAKALYAAWEKQHDSQSGLYQNQLKEVEALRVKERSEVEMLTLLKQKAKDQAPLAEWNTRFQQFEAEEVGVQDSSVEQLEDMLIRAQQAAAAIDPNPEAVDNYRRLMTQIATLKAEIQKLNSAHQNSLSILTEKQGAWEERLEHLIAQINKQFGLYFAQIKCQGQVELSRDEDLKKFGIEIKVSFRNGIMQHLSANTQSGGEKSVSTMLYLLSLQNISDCPFRVVDEINQGMDAVNERVIFELIVKTSRAQNLPQYFVITPKLLPNLPYPNDATILFVFNGIFWKGNNELNFERMVERTAQFTTESGEQQATKRKLNK